MPFDSLATIHMVRTEMNTLALDEENKEIDVVGRELYNSYTLA